GMPEDQLLAAWVAIETLFRDTNAEIKAQPIDLAQPLVQAIMIQPFVFKLAWDLFLYLRQMQLPNELATRAQLNASAGTKLKLSEFITYLPEIRQNVRND